MSQKKIVALDRSVTYKGVNYLAGVVEMPSEVAELVTKKKFGTITGYAENEAETEKDETQNQAEEITLESLSKMKRSDLDTLATEKGVENPAGYPNIGALAEATFNKINEGK